MMREFLNKTKGKRLRIAVVGDILIDEYYAVNVERISPEAPVPVLHSIEDKPTRIEVGGAAKVARMLQNWNVDCDLYGVVDHDAFKICRGFDLDIMPAIEGKTPRKKRFYHTQSVIRWDVESPKNTYSKYAYDLLFNNFKDKDYDIAILSDYDKGLFSEQFAQEIIALSNEKGILTIVDPKKAEIKWRGCSVFKPNYKEAYAFTGEVDPEKQATKLHERLGSSVVVTLGGDGIVGFNTLTNSTYCYRPVRSLTAEHALYGFSGAGDAFIAFIALSLGRDFNLEEASKIAWKAGAIYIGKEHNQPLNPLDLSDKFVDMEDLIKRDFKLTVSNGVFDILTLAHVKSLEFAKSKGNKLAVLVNSDESVKRLKGESRPINNLEHRMGVLAALHCVDYVLSFNEDSPYELIAKLKPNVLVKGGDYNKKPKSADLVDEFYFAPLLEGVSTSNIIKKIEGNNA